MNLLLGGVWERRTWEDRQRDLGHSGAHRSRCGSSPSGSSSCSSTTASCASGPATFPCVSGGQERSDGHRDTGSGSPMSSRGEEARRPGTKTSPGQRCLNPFGGPTGAREASPHRRRPRGCLLRARRGRNPQGGRTGTSTVQLSPVRLCPQPKQFRTCSPVKASRRHDGCSRTLLEPSHDAVRSGRSV